MNRPKFVVGNWKMNPASLAEAEALARTVKTGVPPDSPVRVAVCPPFTYLYAIDKTLENCPVTLGAQNMHWENTGAFTGDISAAMLLDAGCTHVILGHSERRHGMGESNEIVNQKLLAALAARIIPIVCLGETLAERQSGQTEHVLESQLKGSLAALDPSQIPGIVLAYEPVWAIGTGVVATTEQAQSAHAFIRAQLATSFGEAIAARVTVQYGGSVKPDNAADLLACPDIDGALVGGASLKSPDFLAIVAAAATVSR
jgi:triosephosphate isomerase